MKRNRTTRKQMTLRQLGYRMILSVFIPVVTVLLFCGAVVAYNYSRNLRSTLSTAATGYAVAMEERMGIGQKSVQTIYYIDNAGPVLAISKDAWRTFEIVGDLIDRCKQSIQLQDNIVGYFLTYNGGTEYRYALRTGTDVGTELSLKAALADRNREDVSAHDWSVLLCGDTRYLIYTYGKYGVFLTVVMDMPLDHDYDTAKLAFDYEGEVFGAAADRVTDSVRSMQDGARNTGLGMVYRRSLDNIGFVVYAFPDRFHLGAGRSVYYLVALMAAAAMLGGFFGIRLIQRQLIVKLGEMERSILRISDGDTEARMDVDTGISELIGLQDAFNNMLDQIRTLKIESYEKTLNQQKTMLQYLRLQLKPHFVLNCMTSLYALAKAKSMEKLEDRILTISDYFRYELQDDFSLRSLAEELQFTRNALKIRGDSGNFEITLKESIEPELMRISVPALVIESFVENSVKYAVSEGELKIQISVMRVEEESAGEPMLDIIVSDNGRGYSEEWLRILNGREQPDAENKHVGLLSLIKRLQILYGDRQRVQVTNYNGAVSEILIPISTGSEEARYEFADR